MQAKLSDNVAAELTPIKAAAFSNDLRQSGQLLMLVLNFIPLFHVIVTVGLLWLVPLVWWKRIAIAIVFFYLAPPLLARLVKSFHPIPQGRISIGTRAFFAWWTLFQLQVVFSRWPAMEETVRLIPGLYSQWLRLWGAQIGRLTYWSPGTLITDRSFLRVGDNVVFGAGVRLNSHVLNKSKNGEMQLLLADLKIGDRVMVGGYSLLTAGTELASDECTRAFLISPPFSEWKQGRRVRRGEAADFE